MNTVFNRLASFALGAILGAALSAPALADSVVTPPAVPNGYVDYATNATYATNSGYAASANYANGAGYASSAGYAANAGYAASSGSGSGSLVAVHATDGYGCGQPIWAGFTSLEKLQVVTLRNGAPAYRALINWTYYTGQLESMGSAGYILKAVYYGSVC